jgi:rubredoxin
MKTPAAARDPRLAQAFADLPERLTCPRCGRSRKKEFFGVRVVKKDARGRPLQIYRQSYCRDCR